MMNRDRGHIRPKASSPGYFNLLLQLWTAEAAIIPNIRKRGSPVSLAQIILIIGMGAAALGFLVALIRCMNDLDCDGR
jgi:hypothetical protein